MIFTEFVFFSLSLHFWTAPHPQRAHLLRMLAAQSVSLHFAGPITILICCCVFNPQPQLFLLTLYISFLLTPILLLFFLTYFLMLLGLLLLAIGFNNLLQLRQASFIVGLCSLVFSALLVHFG